ncbi:DUF6114 domain-containing protein [Corynebacterium sp. 21KM1197]|uniref:DUF6114 domain-containing protein n=1 Tax=Corynebacterium sp. 21KM1197 TaxID=2989734 RepID=UPI0029C9E5F5|nr:DUF6114 domain-containing protein [Corynebacterium sp. 21KM1197]WPF67873.1 DUF6114 domain-containing protein [Corynebacterium sp. 21KM1197]
MSAKHPHEEEESEITRDLGPVVGGIASDDPAGPGETVDAADASGTEDTEGRVKPAADYSAWEDSASEGSAVATAAESEAPGERPAPVAAAQASSGVARTGAENNAPSESTTEKLEKNNRRFTAWRKQRPFGAGLVMIFAGAVIMTPAYLSFEISNIQVQVSTISGVSTLIIGALLIVSGFLTWFRGEGRILTGVVSLILGVVALPTSNFGGFGVGTLLALIGGALALSWTEADKAPKERKKKRRRAAGSGAAAAVVATALGVSMMEQPAAEANQALLPRIQDVIPFLPQEEENSPQPPAGEQPQTPPGDSNANVPAAPPAIPGIPGLPGLPELPPLPTPEELRERGEEILNGDIMEKINAAPLPQIPGLDLAPPEPIAWTVPPSGNRYTVMTDKTSLVGNVKFSYVTIDTAQGPRQAIRIDADHAILDNLSVRFPGDASGVPPVWKRSEPGAITTLNGNFHIIVHAVEVTPQVAGVTLPLSLNLSADMPPEELKSALQTLGVGVPDVLSDQMVMLNGTMDTYYISSDDLIASPVTTFRAE